jgi:hypothetical protein
MAMLSPDHMHQMSSQTQAASQRNSQLQLMIHENQLEKVKENKRKGIMTSQHPLVKSALGLELYWLRPQDEVVIEGGS